MPLEAFPWLGQGWPYKEATRVREDAHPASCVSLYTNIAAHHFPTAVNHINCEFDICVSFC